MRRPGTSVVPLDRLADDRIDAQTLCTSHDQKSLKARFIITALLGLRANISSPTLTHELLCLNASYLMFLASDTGVGSLCVVVVMNKHYSTISRFWHLRRRDIHEEGCTRFYSLHCSTPNSATMCRSTLLSLAHISPTGDSSGFPKQVTLSA